MAAAVRDGCLPVTEVPGLYYLPNFLSEEEEKLLLENLTADGGWTALSTGRRVLHYGHAYSYQSESVEMIEDPRVPGVPYFPPFLQDLRYKISQIKSDRRIGTPPSDENLFFPASSTFDQLIINEYSRSQGIKPHVDRKHCFGPFVVAVSVGFPAVDISFVSPQGDRVVNVTVEARSLYVMSGPSRYEWRHGISGEQIKGFGSVPRVSLTFRTVIHAQDGQSSPLHKKTPLILSPSTALSAPAHVVRFVEIPNGVVGRIVGKRGKDLRKLKRRTGTEISIGQLPETMGDQGSILARVEGPPQAVDDACQWIKGKLENLQTSQSTIQAS